jgi:hypothetical protein
MNYFVFDVESVGLQGEGWAYGYVVVDETGQELEKGRATCYISNAKGDADGRKWIAENCPSLPPSCTSPIHVRRSFTLNWNHWQRRGAILVADCPWPVEARFLLDCVADGEGMLLPYPFIDVASVVLAAGGDPTATFERSENELPKHDPLCDARQSARILIEHLDHIKEDQKNCTNDPFWAVK